jgi:alpha-beta hydrolase superfamily lysophospholipase
VAHHKITYFSEGHVIAATLFTPDSPVEGKTYPAVVLCQGFGGIRETPNFTGISNALNEAGYIALAFDYRGWGESGGSRGRLAPLDQVDDIRNSITYLEALDAVDLTRIGLLGVSYGCLTATHSAAIDQRVKATLGCLGVATGYQAVTNIRTSEEMAEWEEKVREARRSLVLCNDVERSLKGQDIFRDEQSLVPMPAYWENVPLARTPMGFDSIGRVMDHRPIDVVHKISPRALGLLCATADSCADPASLRQLYNAALEPKKWIPIEGLGHYDLYGAHFERFTAEIIGFFDEFLAR